MKRTIHINEDDGHFYGCHPAEDMTVAGLRRLVDFYARGTQVTSVLFCVSMQKAMFDSKTREPIYEGYDPDGGPDQPFLQGLNDTHRALTPGDHGANWIHNLWLLNRGRGIDQFHVWLERCRHHGVEGWLTVRMNDCHGLQEYEQLRRGTGDYDGWALLCPSSYWKKHPQYRRAPYREERSWEGALDFARPAVRRRQLRFIQEVLERYDLFGLELDWLRWALHFKPGYEAEGRSILNAFVREVHELCRSAARRLKHPVRLGVRVPAEPQSAWDLGYDVPAWCAEGHVDQVVISGFGGVANFDYPVALWRQLLGKDVRLLALTEGIGVPYPAFGTPVAHEDVWRGNAAAALHRGVDGLYLFNACYMETHEPDRSQFHGLLRAIGSLRTLARHPRRAVVTYPQMYAAGTSARTVLPIPLIPNAVGADLGRMEQCISVRVITGPTPRAGRAILYLGFSPDTTPLKANKMKVWVNGHRCKTARSGPPALPAINSLGWARDYTDRIGQLFKFDIPLQVLQRDTNMVELLPSQVRGELCWVEIAYLP